jgi:mannose-1-phosphate guanylyltransferase
MPIRGRPLLDYWLQALMQSDFNNVYVNTHYLSEIVKDYLSQDRFHKWVTPIYEKNILGTAGAIRGAAAHLSGESIFIAHADNWCNIKINEFIASHALAKRKGCLISMVSFITEEPRNCGICEVNDGILAGFREKDPKSQGNIANGAIYIFEQEVIEWITSNPNIIDISTQVIPHYLGKIAVWKHNGYLRDIGNIQSLLKAQSDEVPDNIFKNEDWDFRYQVSDICRIVKNLK